MPRQLTFDLPVRPALGREAFFAAPANANALAAIDDWQNWPGARHLLIGPEGSGKTHLTHVWAGLSGARIVAGSSLTTETIPTLVQNPAVAVEDADVNVDETALFHLLNLTQAEGVPLLITARHSPAKWGLSLPDLQSRLSSIPIARLDPPDDTLLAAVLVKLLDDRQLGVAPNVIDYLLPRIERSFEAARAIVDRLDAAALSERRPITTHLVRAVLDKPDDEDA